MFCLVIHLEQFFFIFMVEVDGQVKTFKWGQKVMQN